MLYKAGLSAPDFKALTLVEALRWRAAHQGEEIAYTFLLDGETQEAHLTYAELDRRARSIGASLQALRAEGRAALLLYPPGLEYIASFFGCLYAGVVAVPLYPPRLNRHLLRLRSILTDAQAAVALTDARSLERLKPLFNQLPELKGIRWAATDSIPHPDEDDWQESKPDGDSLALLQYTSGSTGVPRGVMLSHRNLIHNSTLLAQAFGYTSETLCVSWLPVYHDMGLIGGVIQPLYGGFPCVLMSPTSFLQRPARWLQAISRYQAILSGAPNFAYDLCARRVTSEQSATLDLSSWSVAFNGAEPIREETLRRFAQRFEPCGFRPQAFFPCYGLAEATLMVSGGPKNGPPVVKIVDARSLERGCVAEVAADAEGARTLVCSGKIAAGERAVVVNPETLTECQWGEVGEIWVSGHSVARGYWNHPDETARTFRAHLSGTGEGPFLRTGDLGFIDDDELFITGRLKDLIIIRGRNHYPHDIELSVEQSHPALRPAGGAAFSIEVAGEEKLVVVQEIEHRREPDLNGAVNRIRQAVAEEHEVQVYALVLLRPGSIPKTSSGKIQRHACRAGFLTSSLDALAEWRETMTPGGETPALIPKPTSSNKEEIEAYLAAHLAARLGMDAAAIDTNQSITHYGLDSLGAIELSHRIESGLGIVLPMLSLLQGHSIGELATKLASRLQESGSDDGALLLRSEEENSSYPLSQGQRALWYLQQAAPESAAYNVSSALRIRGELSGRALRQSFQRLVDRHPSLRTNFTAPSGEPLQTVDRRMSLDFIEEDASDRGVEELHDRLNREAHRPFNLEREPPMRIRLFTRSASEHVLLLAAHHIALDFWSLGILMRELMTLYAAEKSGIEAALEPLELQYADYVRWQKDALASREGERLWSYWEKQLSGDLPLLNLPVDHPRPPVQTYRGASLPFQLSAELTQRLRSLARTQGATLYMLLLAAYQSLLYRYTGQDTILIGSSAACRSRAGLAGLVGYFVNPLVLRGDLSGDPTFASFLAGVRQTVLEAFEYQDYPFSLLVERLQPARDPSRTPLFQAMFVLHKAQRPDEDYLSLLALGEAAAQVKLDGLELESIPLEQRTSQFELTLAMAETEDRLSGALQYNTDLFAGETIRRMAEHYRVLLESVVADPNGRLSALPLLTAEEQEQILHQWNETREEYPSEKCLHQLFEEQVERTPDAVAVVYEEEQVSYGELNRRANRLAHHLRSLGVRAESLVGIMMERSIEMAVALLGVLKAGAAYVPLDPEYPPQRLSFMLEDAGIEVLLTQSSLAEQVAQPDTYTLCLDTAREATAAESELNVESEVVAENLAYVIYTSGSTGTPKGVMISHRGLVNYLNWCVKAYDVKMGGGGGVPLHSSIGFDLTVTSLFAPLLAGQTVVVSESQGGEALISTLRLKSDYSFVKLTPSHLDVLSQIVAVEETAGVTRMFVVGGEALHSETIDLWRKYSPATRIVNEYGPTETVVGCCAYEVAGGSSITGPVPIGRPIANTQLYILDEHLNPLPPGVAGELYVGGVGLARGYLNSPDLTARKFIPHPFSREAGARLYRTGDRARYLPDGNIEFLGRFDEQVKLRGYRVEPQEIEAVLREHPAIRETVVIVNKNAQGTQRLSAYFVPADRHSPTTAELRDHLKERLPEYMVPAVLVKLEEMPLTAHGKVDRKALRSLEHTGPDSEGFIAPRTETERMLVEIWSRVLDIRRVGVHDNFFELGGHSLIAAQIVSRARDVFGVELPLSTLLRSPTVAELAEAVESNRAALRRSRITPASRANRRAKLSEDGATVLSDDVKEQTGLPGD